MKQIYFILTFIFSFALNAQTTNVIVDITQPQDILFIENDLYFLEFNGKLSKIDITDISSTPTLITDQLYSPTKLQLNGNDLFILETNSRRIKKIDLTDSTPNLVLVSQMLNPTFPTDILIDGNDIYIVDSNEDKILKIDTTENFPITPSEFIILDERPSGLAKNGNDLYVSLSSVGKIIKIDVTEINPEPVEVINNLYIPSNLTFDGNNLYISENHSDGKVARIDISDTNPVLVDIVTELNLPGGTSIKSNELYICEMFEDRIIKLDLSSLSIDDITTLLGEIKIYPNPTQNYLSIKGINTFEKYTIYNELGVVVKKGVVSENSNIKISDLSSGTYILKIQEQDEAFKFIKN